MKSHLKTYGWMYALAAFLAAGALFSACATPQVNRFIEDYVQARQDGKVDAAEIAVLDRDAADAAESAPPFHLPPTGNPLLDTALQLGEAALGLGLTAVGTHKYTMSVRDRLAAAAAPTPTPPAA